MTTEPADSGAEHTISVVIPVYGGEHHLAAVVEELVDFSVPRRSDGGAVFRVVEVLLVHDCGPDDSARVMQELEAKHPFVRTVWLSRNFGQHAATLAGMASSGGDWIVTLDEDGQHDPESIGDMLDTAIARQASVVYAAPLNAPPHGALRNLTSRGAKRLVKSITGGVNAPLFNSYRMILGEVGRSVAAYAGSGVYLDVALGWVAGEVASTPVLMREEGTSRRSGYTLRALLSHFWRMILTGGTRGLRLVSVAGVVFAVLGLVLALVLVIQQLTHPVPVEGWTSLAVLVLICTGAILFALGVIAEYVGVAVNMAMGKPLYLITRAPADGPLARRRET